MATIPTMHAELTWDITDWPQDADLSLANIQENMHDTFVYQSLALPASILCREDQKDTLLKAYAIPCYDETPYFKIDVGFGPINLKVLPDAPLPTKGAIYGR